MPGPTRPDSDRRSEDGGPATFPAAAERSFGSEMGLEALTRSPFLAGPWDPPAASLRGPAACIVLDSGPRCRSSRSGFHGAPGIGLGPGLLQIASRVRRLPALSAFPSGERV